MAKVAHHFIVTYTLERRNLFNLQGIMYTS